PVHRHHALNVLLVDNFVWAVHIVFGGANKTPVPGIGSVLQLLGITAAGAFYFQLVRYTGGLGYTDDFLNIRPARDQAVAHRDGNALPWLYALGYPGNIRNKRLVHAITLQNVFGQVGY